MLVMKHPIDGTDIYFSIDFPTPQTVALVFVDGTVMTRHVIHAEADFANHFVEATELVADMIEERIGVKIFQRQQFADFIRGSLL